MVASESLDSLPDEPNRVFPVGRDFLAVTMPDKQLWQVDLTRLRGLPEFDSFSDGFIADLFKIAGHEVLVNYAKRKSKPDFRPI